MSENLGPEGVPKKSKRFVFTFGIHSGWEKPIILTSLKKVKINPTPKREDGSF